MHMPFVMVLVKLLIVGCFENSSEQLIRVMKKPKKNDLYIIFREIMSSYCLILVFLFCLLKD
jgi:hypothetical protein